MGEVNHRSPEGMEYSRNHDIHGPNPVFKESGWGEGHPCGSSGCPRHDEEYSDRLEDAYATRIHETRRLNPDQFGQLRPLESVVNHDYVQSSGNTHPPVVAELPGYPGLHVLDGHHRLLRAQQAGQSIDVHVKSG